MPWWKWWAPRCPHLCPAIWGFNLPHVNMAEIGQSKLKREKPVWLTEAVKIDMIKFTRQSDDYKKFISNTEKIGGHGPTLKKHTERECAEERRFVDQLCDVIEHGNLFEEVADQDELSFMPSARAKHKAPKNDLGIQEKTKQKKTTKDKVAKELPKRTG